MKTFISTLMLLVQISFGGQAPEEKAGQGVSARTHCPRAHMHVCLYTHVHTHTHTHAHTHTHIHPTGTEPAWWFGRKSLNLKRNQGLGTARFPSEVRANSPEAPKGQQSPITANTKNPQPHDFPTSLRDRRQKSLKKGPCA